MLPLEPQPAINGQNLPGNELRRGREEEHSLRDFLHTIEIHELTVSSTGNTLSKACSHVGMPCCLL